METDRSSRPCKSEGKLGQDELYEFREIIQDYKPSSAVQWLTNYFDTVKVIYAFQLLNAAFDDNNFKVISSIKTKIRELKTSQKIVQKDYATEKMLLIVLKAPRTV